MNKNERILFGKFAIFWFFKNLREQKNDFVNYFIDSKMGLEIIEKYCPDPD